MRRKLPSNSSLMAFEAAARHNSFARAAEELALTEGAISRQIARLEEFLGAALFTRTGNRVQLAPNGLRYATQVREVLDRLERDSQYVMGQQSDGGSLDIAVSPTFASRWLIPRMKRFQEAHPAITVHLAERAEPFVLPGSGFDGAIHFEHPAWAGMHIYPLLHEVLVPVCAPALLAGLSPATALDRLPRLHKRQTPDAWQRYARENGVVLENPANGARYDLYAMLIEAALASLGIALIPRLYVETEIAQGRLAAPWPNGTSVAKTFCLVLPDPLGLSPGPLQTFSRWLLDVAGEPAHPKRRAVRPLVPPPAGGTLQAPFARGEAEMTTYCIEAVGHVRGGRSDPTDDNWGASRAIIELDTAVFAADALAGLERFSHAEVVFVFDRVPLDKIETGARHPRGRTDWPLTGIFAQRGKNRPNRLAVTICRILSVSGTQLEVAGLDAIDGTPVVDIKPVMRAFLPREDVMQPDWVSELMARYW